MRDVILMAWADTMRILTAVWRLRLDISLSLRQNRRFLFPTGEPVD